MKKKELNSQEAGSLKIYMMAQKEAKFLAPTSIWRPSIISDFLFIYSRRANTNSGAEDQ
jgi:hypothetical protein